MKTENTIEQNETFETIAEARTHSGGFRWTQKLLYNNVWYFVNDASLKSREAPNWLISNSCLSILLGTHSKTLSKFNTSTVNAVPHSNAPTSFLDENSASSKARNNIRTKQTMWTLAGVAYILQNVKTNRSEDFITKFKNWIEEQSVIYEKSNIDKADPAAININDRDAAKKAANYIAQIINQWNKECILNSRLSLANARLKQQVHDLEEQIKNLKSQINNPTKFLSDLKSLNGDKKYDLHSPDSLSQFISKLGVVKSSDQLTRAGLLNSDQVFSIFGESWKCPSKGTLIHKNEFQAVLKSVFHTKNSTHRAPVITANALRNNYVAVCRVACKKKPNPLDADGKPLDTDNPAYISSSQPCIRLQPRYTSKAIEYLINNWNSLVRKYLAIKS